MAAAASIAGGCTAPEGALNADQLVQRFVRCVVHNMSNSLAGISGCAQILERTLSSDGEVQLAQCRAYVEMVDQEAQRCARVLESLALLARPPQPRCVPVDLNAVLWEASAAFPCPEGIRLHVERAPGQAVALADATLLVDALSRVLENAAEAMPGGGVISLSVEEITEDSAGERDWLLVTVADSGPGIPADALPHVTEPFFSTRQGRNGIGLAICKQLVVSQQGRLTVCSPAAGGAQVTIALPRRRHPGEQVRAQHVW